MKAKEILANLVPHGGRFGGRAPETVPPRMTETGSYDRYDRSLRAWQKANGINQGNVPMKEEES